MYNLMTALDNHRSRSDSDTHTVFLKSLYSEGLSFTSDVFHRQFSPEIPLVSSHTDPASQRHLSCFCQGPLSFSHPRAALHSLAKSACVSAPSPTPLWSQEAEGLQQTYRVLARIKHLIEKLTKPSWQSVRCPWL